MYRCKNKPFAMDLAIIVGLWPLVLVRHCCARSPD